MPLSIMHVTQQSPKGYLRDTLEIPRPLQVANEHTYFNFSTEREIQPFSDHRLKNLKTSFSGTSNNVEAF